MAQLPTFEMIKTATLLTVCFISQQSPFVAGAKLQCLQCSDLNRQSKTDAKCITDYDQCGGCKAGYVQDIDDEKQCITLEVLESGDDIIIEKGNEKVFMPCKFNARINCRWTHNGKEVDIASSTRFTWDDGDGTDTHNCGMIIAASSYDDVGQWVCSNVPDSTYKYSVTTKPITISIDPNSDVAKQYGQEDASNIVKVEISHGVSYEEPKIFYNENDITHRTLKYNPVVDQLFQAINCKTKLPTARMTWLIHGKPEYSGLKWSSSELRVDDELKNSIISYLQSNHQVELLCLVEYLNQDSHSASIFITDKVSKPALKVAGNFTPMITTIVVILIIILFVVLTVFGATIYYFKRNTKSSLKSVSCESQDTVHTQTDVLLA